VHGAWVEVSATFAGKPLGPTLPNGGHGWTLTANESAALPFGLEALPRTLNNDVTISIRLANATAPPTVILRRLMRAPPPASSVRAVQVDHWTRGLLVDGMPFDGNGWYLGAFGNGYQPQSLNQLRDHLPQLVQQGINMAMVGSLNSLYFNYSAPNYQKQFLDAAAASGMKIIYPVFEGVNVSIAGGGPYDKPALFETLKANLRGVVERRVGPHNVRVEERPVCAESAHVRGSAAARGCST